MGKVIGHDARVVRWTRLEIGCAIRSTSDMPRLTCEILDNSRDPQCPDIFDVPDRRVLNPDSWSRAIGGAWGS